MMSRGSRDANGSSHVMPMSNDNDAEIDTAPAHHLISLRSLISDLWEDANNSQAAEDEERLQKAYMLRTPGSAKTASEAMLTNNNEQRYHQPIEVAQRDPFSSAILSTCIGKSRTKSLTSEKSTTKSSTNSASTISANSNTTNIHHSVKIYQISDDGQDDTEYNTSPQSYHSKSKSRKRDRSAAKVNSWSNMATGRTESAPLLYMPAVEPLPSHTNPAMIKSSWATPDCPDLTHVPSCLEHVDEPTAAKLLDSYDMRPRERLLTYGPQWKQERVNKLLLHVFDGYEKQCMLERSNADHTAPSNSLIIRQDEEDDVASSPSNSNVNDKGIIGQKASSTPYKTLVWAEEVGADKDPYESPTPFASAAGQSATPDAKDRYLPQRVLETIAAVSGEDIDRVQEQHEAWIENFKVTDATEPPEAAEVAVAADCLLTTATAVATSTSADTGTLYCLPVAHNNHNNENSNIDALYCQVASSYRDLYCSRCYVYDCNFHGSSVKPQLEDQLVSAAQREARNLWKKTEPQQTERLSRIFDTQPFAHVKELSDTHKALFKSVMVATRGNMQKASIILRAPILLLEQHARDNPVDVEQYYDDKRLLNSHHRKKHEKIPYYSLRNYNPAWLNKIKSAQIFPMFEPCDHTGMCKAGTCTCIDHAFFCNKACVWGPMSPNFFRGCNCQGTCTNGFCTCVDIGRECDPDVCKCCNPCAGPPGLRSKEYKGCCNDKISMRRHCRLLVGRSAIPEAGWGCFTKDGLQKGDYVCEYIGELISQDEADRRGQLYDMQNRNSLFNYTSDFSLDAYRKGSKSRYINHSEAPNVETRVIFVNGDIRIGMFARQDIAAQEELFFDYRYNCAIENELIVKPAKTVFWMKLATPKSSKSATTTGQSDSGLDRKMPAKKKARRR
jgi:SET domain